MNISNLSRLFLAIALVASFGMSSLSAMKRVKGGFVTNLDVSERREQLEPGLILDLQKPSINLGMVMENFKKELREDIARRYGESNNTLFIQECNKMVNAHWDYAIKRCDFLLKEARSMADNMKPEEILEILVVVVKQLINPGQKLSSFIKPALMAGLKDFDIGDCKDPLFLSDFKNCVVNFKADRILKLVDGLVDRVVNARMKAKVVDIVEKIYIGQQKAQEIAQEDLEPIINDIITFKEFELEQELTGVLSKEFDSLKTQVNDSNLLVDFLKPDVLLKLNKKTKLAQIKEFIGAQKNLKIRKQEDDDLQRQLEAKEQQKKDIRQQEKLNKLAQKQEAEKEREQFAKIFAASLNEEQPVELKPEESQISYSQKWSPKSDYSDISKVETKSTQSNQSESISNSIDEAAEGEKPESPTLCQKVATRQPDIIDPKIEISIKDLEAIGFTRDQRVWISPKKLKYNGLGAMQHVLQHNHEKSDKYTHTVFKTSSYIETLELIDEAWAKIKGKNKESHKYSGTYDYAREGASANAQAYVADMGRTIGTSDETRILIVTLGCHDDTIVTAYPFQ